MLETSFTLPNGVVVSNRLAKAATTEAVADPGGQPSAALQEIYRRWGQSGAGLIVTGNVGVDPLHPVRPGDVMMVPGVDTAALAKWAGLAKQGGARVVLQICHAGRQTQRFTNPRPLAPSAVSAVKAFKAFGDPRAATLEEIADVRERFVRAALLGEAAGFDGCQVHAAHGYLLSQFLSPSSNARNDAYGGAIENRARLLLEIVREVKRRRASPSFAVTVKLNSGDFLRGGLSSDDALEVVALLEQEGIDLLEVSGGTYEQPASFGLRAPSPREAYFLEFSREARRRTRVPLMLTGGFRSRSAMEAALEEGAVDLVGVARPFCVEPELGKRLLASPTAALTGRTRWFGPKPVQALGEMAWYSEQLQRLGRGLDPDLAMTQLGATLRHLARDYTRAQSERSVQRGLLAPAAV
jgi:2,4-dienoyl-CoA reductase-like NADH-dependent reductase (Old Yellow Enzyme family)